MDKVKWHACVTTSRGFPWTQLLIHVLFLMLVLLISVSKSIEALRFVFRTVRSFWNLTSTLAALLLMRLSNFEAIRSFKLPILRLRDVTRSCDKTFHGMLKRGPVIVIWCPIVWQTNVISGEEGGDTHVDDMLHSYNISSYSPNGLVGKYTHVIWCKTLHGCC